MSFRSLASLRCAVFLTAVFAVSACSDGGLTPLSGVQVVDVPATDTGPEPQVNQNISNPTLEIPQTYQVSDGDVLTLVWSEEFDGPQIDPEVWFFATGDGAEKGLQGWGNNELQYYLPDNAQVVNGALEITARRETVEGFNYTSARINTEDRFAFKYGRIEARMKLPPGQGIWPAFWMLSQDSPYGSWAATGEIDIMEAINLGGTGGNQIFGTLHYGGEAPANTFTSATYTPSVNVTADFHTYALEWDEFEFRWYFDGLLYATQNSWNSTAAPYPAPFDQPFHILLNVAVGGNFPGSPNATTPFPVTMAVDWVRVYSGEEPTGPGPQPADRGTVPDDVIYASDPNEMVDIVFGVDYADFSPFGSGSTFDNDVRSDADFSPAFGVTTGDGYGAQVGQFAIVGFASGFASGYATLDFKAKGLNNDLIRIKFLDDPNYLDITLTTSPYSTALGNGWYQVSIPLADASGVDMATGLLFETDGTAASSFTFLLTDFGFSGTADGGGGAGGGGQELVVNGDFETGDLTGWTSFDNGGTIMVSSPGSDGTFAGNIDATGGAFNPTLKQANLGAGQLTPGQQVTVTFDWKGTAGVGGVVDAVLFSEASGGGASQADQILSGDAFPADWTTVGPLTITIGPDVGGGVTLQFTAICGGDASCESNLFLDNVSIVTGGGDTGGGGGDTGGGGGDTGGGGDGGGGGGDGGGGDTGGGGGDGGGGDGGGGGGGDTGGGGSGGGQELITNGDFETGTLGGWTIAENGGSIAVVTPGSGSMFAANVDASGGPGNATLKQANLGLGQLAAGQQVTVSFDWKGAAAVGGVVNINLFSEGSNGVTQTVEIVGPATAVPADWAAFGPMSVDVGTDVSGGVTLEVAVVCGAESSCEASLFLDNVSITADVGGDTGGGGGGTGGGQDLITNGDFETGTLGGWTTADNGGSISVVSPGSGSMFAANVDASGGPGNATLKQANLGLGQLAAGQEVSVSFDWKGAAAVGGVVNINLFSEGSNGVTQTVEIVGPATAVPADWAAFGPMTVDVGSDVSGGVTLEVAVVCGAESSCQASLFLDNVSITVGGSGTGGGGGDTGGGGGTVLATFDEATPPSITAYGGAVATIEAGPAGGDDTNALKIFRDGGQDFAGAYVIVSPIPSDAGAQTLSALVYSPTAGVPMPARVANASAGTGDVEANEAVVAGWQTLTWTFSNLDPAQVYTRFAITPNQGTVDTAASYFFDNITLVGGGGGDTGGSEVALATFDEVPTPEVTPFGGAVTTIETGPAGGDGSNTLNIVRNGGEVYAGAWVAIPAIPSDAGVQTVSAEVYSPTAGIPMVAKAEFGDNMGSGDVQANEAVVAGWQTLTWTFTNLDSAQTYNRFVMLPNLGTVDTAATSYFFDNITLLAMGGGDTGGGGGGGGTAAGDIAINGGFETGMFNDGTQDANWLQFPDGGIQEITTDNPSSGTYAAHLVVPVRSQTDPAMNNLIKNANLEAGNLTPGASVTVNFDMRGSLSGAGGVVFAEFFSELSGGGTSKAEIFTGGPLAPAANWTPYSFTTTLGPDVSGGATLQLKTSCGPVEGCGVDVFFDNVTITIN